VSEAKTADQYLQRFAEIFGSWDSSALEEAFAVLKAARDRAATVFIIGNGGSAATASHMATDLGVGSLATKGLRAIALTDNSAVITAAGNDFGYDSVFAKQLQLLARSGDILVAISASGNSRNVIRALEVASQLRMTTIGLTGFDGGEVRTSVDVSVHVPTKPGEYGPVEDLHLIINHALTVWLRNEL
jgi:D-sedoheptulose 7-phosphate isomerase